MGSINFVSKVSVLGVENSFALCLGTTKFSLNNGMHTAVVSCFFV
jgi:hypothetical protein